MPSEVIRVRGADSYASEDEQGHGEGEAASPRFERGVGGRWHWDRGHPFTRTRKWEIHGRGIWWYRGFRFVDFRV
jgi:hypothetical protein